MNQNVHTPEVLDYRRASEVWQRVKPGMEAYPEVGERVQGMGSALAPMGAAALPGAVEDPCCMGTAAGEMLGVLTGFIEEELEDCRTYLAMLAAAPQRAKQRIRELAGEEKGHARQLMAVYYLITGMCYQSAMPRGQVRMGDWCAALRRRYHEEACGGLNYARAAEGTTDVCLRKLFNDLSAGEYRHADVILGLLQREMH